MRLLAKAGTGTGTGTRRQACHLLGWVALLLFSLWVRWPSPEFPWQHVDEQAFVDYPLGFWGGDLNPHFFNYPTLHFYLVSLLYYLYYLLFSSASLISFVAFRFFVDASDLMAIARGANTLLAVGTVAVSMRLGRRLYGWQGAWTAGLVLALMPLHVRFSHLAITDVPAVWWMSLSLLWAVRVIQQNRRSDYLLAGVFMGLAAATKYPLVLVGLPVLGAAWWRSRAAGKTGFWLTGFAALGAFSLATPYVWLDFGRFWNDFTAMGEEHLIESGHQISDPAWLHLLRYNLRYGLGLAGLLTAGLALCWRPRRLRPEEVVLAASLAANVLLLSLAHSTFMRYALPMAPPAAVLMARPLLGLSRRRPVFIGWLVVLLVEPAYAAVKTRCLLSGPDTRAQVVQWLQQSGGVRLVQVPPRVADTGVLTPSWVYTRQYRFVQSYDWRRLSQAYAALAQRGDLPPLYTRYSLQTIKQDLAAQTAETAGYAILLWCRHPLCCPCAEPAEMASLAGYIQWQEEFSAGRVEDAVFDQADWYFLPIGGWDGVEQTGPTICLGKIPLRRASLFPTAREFFQLLHGVLAARLAVSHKDWPQAVQLYEAILAAPFDLKEILSPTHLFEVFVGAGKSHFQCQEYDAAIASWREAARVKPAEVEPYHCLGITFSILKQPEKAVPFYRQAIALRPDDPDIYCNLGANYMEMGHYQEAVDCYRKVLELAPNHPRAEELRRALQVISGS